jgi:hypothetical protein
LSSSFFNFIFGQEKAPEDFASGAAGRLLKILFQRAPLLLDETVKLRLNSVHPLRHRAAFFLNPDLTGTDG